MSLRPSPDCRDIPKFQWLSDSPSRFDAALTRRAQCPYQTSPPLLLGAIRYPHLKYALGGARMGNLPAEESAGTEPAARYGLDIRVTQRLWRLPEHTSGA